jgi:hypothetical protein
MIQRTVKTIVVVEVVAAVLIGIGGVHYACSRSHSRQRLLDIRIMIPGRG